MERLQEFLHTVVLLDALAVGVVFMAGVVVAPIAILVHDGCWWRRRLKWATVALLTSWFGLWLFRRDQSRWDASQAGSSAPRSP